MTNGNVLSSTLAGTPQNLEIAPSDFPALVNGARGDLSANTPSKDSAL